MQAQTETLLVCETPQILQTRLTPRANAGIQPPVQPEEKPKLIKIHSQAKKEKKKNFAMHAM
jgi:hypothetical protein